MTHEIQIAHSTYLSTQIKKRISVGGIDVDEDFVKELLIKHLRQGDANDRPTLSDAFDIYMSENTSAHRRKFKLNANQYFNRFNAMYGDLYLHELKHWHITQYREKLLAQGLHPNNIRKHNNILNAMIHMAFKHLDIDRGVYEGTEDKG